MSLVLGEEHDEHLCPALLMHKADSIDQADADPYATVLLRRIFATTLAPTILVGRVVLVLGDSDFDLNTLGPRLVMHGLIRVT